MAERVHDLVVVGGGFRTTTFLASAPQLLERDLLVLEAGSALGPGGFQDYLLTTTSKGKRFLQHVRYTGPLARLGDDPTVRRVADADVPVDMRDLSAALTVVGRALGDVLGDRLRTRARVSRVELNGDGPVRVILDDGTGVLAAHVLIATGREERPHAALEHWRARTMLSGQVISSEGRSRLMSVLAGLGGRPVVVAGCSHSAMSALLTLRPLTASPVVVLQRSAARLTYDSLREALEAHVPGRERLPDPDRDVCPATGMVFRDSGLRHESADLYRSLWSGEVPGARLQPVRDVTDAADLLDAAGLVVQALGYHGRAPELHEGGVVVRGTDSPDRMRTTLDGAALVAGIPRRTLSVLRIEPTPADLRDNTAYGSWLYQDLANRLDRVLVTA
ncbi:MAG: hypothetical protein J7503_06625 [Cellulomonas iranensis]|uniref:hypothetical protein n=1 Tax=Cellulomonas iranensis TaxID=76862 RepID=UPI001B07E7EC|nr:hypothetical protein [Cellulomonas iranensis]MBO9568483.1 hypothetical protein [Cellulomonas iranensis]